MRKKPHAVAGENGGPCCQLDLRVVKTGVKEYWLGSKDDVFYYVC